MLRAVRGVAFVVLCRAAFCVVCCLLSVVCCLPKVVSSMLRAVFVVC